MITHLTFKVKKNGNRKKQKVKDDAFHGVVDQDSNSIIDKMYPSPGNMPPVAGEEKFALKAGCNLSHFCLRAL